MRRTVYIILIILVAIGLLLGLYVLGYFHGKNNVKITENKIIQELTPDQISELFVTDIDLSEKDDQIINAQITQINNGSLQVTLLPTFTNPLILKSQAQRTIFVDTDTQVTKKEHKTFDEATKDQTKKLLTISNLNVGDKIYNR